MKTYSFDIFDTCMTRTCGKPDNIFRLLAEDVVRDRDESLLCAFVMERKKAEKSAMLYLKKEAVTLNEIYGMFDLAPFTDMSKERVREIEIALELRSFAPIEETIRKINTLRSKGHILFISDMYLPDEVIREGLIKLKIMREGDPLYVSGSVGLSKHTGRLFEYVREKEGIRKGSWTHYGDNIHSDYFMPKKKGIKARWIHTDYSEYEEIIENEKKFFTSPLAVSIFAGLMRTARMEGGNEDGGFVADIMAPLIVPFVDALLKDAVVRRIRRLYFASRDAYVMYLVARELLPSYNGLEIRYLHISTKSVYPASVRKADKAELSRLLRYIGRFSPSKIMRMFDCPGEEMQDMARMFDLDKELRYGSLQADLFIEKLLEGRKQDIMRARCAAKRELLLGYLRQEGFIGDDYAPVGLVDVGWRCTTQESLRKITDAPVRYYYWGVSSRRVGIGQSGPFTSFFYAENFDKQVYRNMTFIELYICRNTEGSTLGYERTDSGIVPVLERHVPGLMDDEILRNYASVLSFARRYRQYACLGVHASALFRQCSLRIMDRFTRYPDKSMAVFLSGRLRWGHYLGKKIPVIIKLYPWTAFYIAFFYCLRNVSDHVYKYRMMWFEASLVYTYGVFGKRLIQYKERLLTSKRLKFLAGRLIHKNL